MASPFRLFRKHKATLLVVAGVLLMFVFVIGDPLMSYIGSAGRNNGGGGRDPRDVAVRWDGGKLTNAELGHLVMRRRVVNALIGQVEYLGRVTAFDAGREPLPLGVEMLILPERPDQDVEQDIVRMAVFATAARRVGMRVSDEQVVRYLQQLGRGYVSTDQLRELIARLRVGGGVSVDYMLDALREELLARNYLASYVFALDTVLPEQRWQDWLSVNDRVLVEAAAIPTELFLVDVAEPTEAALTAFFDQYKDREPRPDLVGGIEMPSPLPGFAVPRKVELQFVRADYDRFLEKVAADVTDDEIEEFYEENKDPYYILDATDLLDSATDAASDDVTADDADETADATTEDESAQAEAVTEDTEPGDVEAIAPESEADPEADATPAEDEQSSTDPLRRRSMFRLAAFTEEGEGDEDSTSTETAESMDDRAVSESATGGGALDEAVVAVEEGEADPSDDATADAIQKPTQFQPLEEVRDQIRREIAQLKATETLQGLIGTLESELGASYATYLGAVLDAEEAGEVPPPPPPELADLSALAQEHGLEYQKTAPISALELRELPVGKSYRTDEENLLPEQRLPFLYHALDRDLELYQPVATFDTDNNRYLVMKIADTPGSVPELADIRDDVVRAWRQQQAAQLALKHAAAEAKQAESADSLEEFFADDEHVTVTTTDPFSRYTVGTVSRRTGDVQSFRLSKPEGIDGADFDVMETIFGLGEGKVGAVLNHDHSLAYLLRVVQHEQTPAELQQAYLFEADRWYGLSAMNRAHSQTAMRVLLADMRESAGVNWKRPPDQPYREEE